MSNEPVFDELFVQNLTKAQGLLYGYILTLLPQRDLAADVLQETNLVLWRKAAEFVPGTNFTAWSCRVAYYQVRAFLTNKARDRHCFDDVLLSKLAARAETHADDMDSRQARLCRCLTKLSPRDHELILARYSKGSSVKTMAGRLQKTENSVSRSLYRIRKLLLECVRRGSLAAGEA